MFADKAYDSMAAVRSSGYTNFLKTGSQAVVQTKTKYGRLGFYRVSPTISHIPMPAGTLLSGGGLWDLLRAEHGRTPTFKINVRAIDQAARLRNGVSVWTYEEWQRNALNASPPDNGRAASVVFVEDPTTATGLKWAHVHETWLPAETIAADAFDW